MLHQRDLDVTEYYSAPTATQIVESVNELHDAYSSYQDIEDAYLRSPQELQKNSMITGRRLVYLIKY